MTLMYAEVMADLRFWPICFRAHRAIGLRIVYVLSLTYSIMYFLWLAARAGGPVS